MIAWYDAKFLRFQGWKWWCDRRCNPGLLVIWSEPWSALGEGATAHPEKSLSARWTQKVSLFQQICCDSSKGKRQIDNRLGGLFSANPFVQETRSSEWSFAIGQSLWMIICKRPVPPDDHLQEAGPSGWSFATTTSGLTGEGVDQGWRDRRRRRGKLLQTGQGDVEGSIRGPRGPNKKLIPLANH